MTFCHDYLAVVAYCTRRTYHLYLSVFFPQLADVLVVVKHFPKDQFHFIASEELRRNPRKVLREVMTSIR